MPEAIAEQPDLDTLRQQRDHALIRAEKLETQLVEAWGDFVDRREFLCDDPAFGLLGSGSTPMLVTSLDDRKDGRFRPVYECEQDLAFHRAAARNLKLLTGVATGALDALSNYTIGSGFTFEAQPENELSVKLAAVVQGVIDDFIDANDFNGVIDRECDRRAREDGECLIAFDEHEISKGRCLVEFIEPDQLTEPLNSVQLDEWLGTEFPTCWKFGVHTPENKTWKPLGYHVVRDGRGADWDYYPANRIEHIKRNVTRNAKRGVSDFLEIAQKICDEAKLGTNMVRGGALQAAIAWILQAAQGQTSGQLSSVGGESRRTTSNAPSALGPNASTTLRNAANYPPGSILKVGFGQEYKPGPMGAERNQGFEVVGQYTLRSIGVRWNMPEYMISGDASNANYSSTLVAGSPFSQARKADQQFYKRHFLSLLWKAVRIHCESGRFERYGVGRDQYDDLLKLVRIDCECPTVDVRDPKMAVDSDKVLVDGGIMSERTWAARNDLDFDKEQKLGAAKAPPPPSPFGGAFGGPPPQSPPGGQQPSQADLPKQDPFAGVRDVPESEGDRWITVNGGGGDGVAIRIDGDGNVTAGPNGLKGKSLSGSSRSKRSEASEDDEPASGRESKPTHTDAPDTNSPEFKQWFGNSKAVDAQGKPITVYHGTQHSFEAFDKAKVGSSLDPGDWGHGFYFGTKDQAEHYGRDRTASFDIGPDGKMVAGGKKANVMAVHLAIQNPFTIVGDRNHDTLHGQHPAVPALKKMFGDKIVSQAIEAEADIPSFVREIGPKKFTETLQKHGFDGFHRKFSDKAEEWVAFEPSQIKSATRNKGSFRRDSDNIHESTRRAAVTAALESVETTDEAKAILETLGAAYP